MRGTRFHSAQALLAVLALAAALTLLMAIRASSGEVELAVFLSSPISPVATPTPTVTPVPTETPTATPAAVESRRYLPLIQVTGRTRLWLPSVLK